MRRYVQANSLDSCSFGPEVVLCMYIASVRFDCEPHRDSINWLMFRQVHWLRRQAPGHDSPRHASGMPTEERGNAPVDERENARLTEEQLRRALASRQAACSQLVARDTRPHCIWRLGPLGLFAASEQPQTSLRRARPAAPPLGTRATAASRPASATRCRRYRRRRRRRWPGAHGSARSRHRALAPC